MVFSYTFYEQYYFAENFGHFGGVLSTGSKFVN